jgi:hypothetical protein
MIRNERGFGQHLRDVVRISKGTCFENETEGRLIFSRLSKSPLHPALFLFSAVFNKYDGQGRPASRGDGMDRLENGAPRMIRTSGPDASSCARTAALLKQSQIGFYFGS